MSEDHLNKIIESEKRHREMLSLFADVIYCLDANDRITYVKHTESVFGYQDQELIGRKCFELIHPEDRPVLKKELQSASKNADILINYKIRILTKNGEVRYCLLSNRTFFENGKPIGKEGVLRDITSLEKLTQQLVEEKTKLQEMYNNLHDSYLALGKLNAQIAALAEINATFSSNLTWREKLFYIIESIRAFLQADETLLFVQDQKNVYFTLRHASLDFAFWEGTVLDKTMPFLKKILKDKKFVECLKPDQCLDKSKTEAKKYRAMFAIPVIINGKVHGVFIVFFKSIKKISNFPAKLALAYTSQMSIALMMSGELDRSLKKIF